MTTPYEFQKVGAWRLHKFNGRGLLADDMGLGKTFQVLIYIRDYLEAEGPIIVVCPALAKEVWRREALRHVNMRSEILSGKKPRRRELKLRNNHLIVINYDILSGWVDTLKALNPSLVILDECHYIKSRSALRTKAVRLLCRKPKVKHIIAMSGTPMANRPPELWPVLNLLKPKLFPNFFAFAKRYTRARRKWYGWEFKGGRNLKELNTLLTETCMIRRRKADVLKDLPPQVVSVVPMEIQNRRKYEATADMVRGWLSKIGWQPKNHIERNEQRRLFGAEKRLAARLKIKSVIRWIDDFLAGSEDKLLVFGIHHKFLRPLHQHYKKVSVLVDGDTSKVKRQLYFDRFNHDTETRLLFGNIDAAGVAWSCTSSSHVAFGEIAWTPGQHNQASDRIRGVGRGIKGQSANIYYLVAKDTCEEAICQLIQNKQATLDRTLDGKEQDDSINIFDQLTAILRRKG